MRATLAAIAYIALAACSAEPEPTPTPTITPTPDKPKTLVPGDFADLVLGAKVGDEAASKFALDGQELAEVTSYVACPEGMDECKPAEFPADTVLTYVHRVTPAKGVAGATLFRTARPAAGFANLVGYDMAEAAAALGQDGKIDVASDNGALVWRVIGGDGWKAGETITFYWQSKLPPEGEQIAYQFEADGTTALGTGPFPPKEKPVEETPAR
ncbi:hypothetical protein GRI89_04485 [Altererythrobacter salegens]|uniref:Lipoprotein n=1 Tax=Croceibacterium salegens TaxID=1737568 RepID=A0A6I4SUN7_9SPHN|nr:hypothetical protein [Croceibacterium salegens]